MTIRKNIFDRIHPGRKAYIALSCAIHDVICDAFREKELTEGLTQIRLAEKLGKDKSFVSRVLNNEENLTLKTVAEFMWAMGKKLRVQSVNLNHAPINAPAPISYQNRVVLKKASQQAPVPVYQACYSTR